MHAHLVTPPERSPLTHALAEQASFFLLSVCIRCVCCVCVCVCERVASTVAPTAVRNVRCAAAPARA